jgi:Arc/MetJ-type ribon-helix-helix transcriptional regulator
MILAANTGGGRVQPAQRHQFARLGGRHPEPCARATYGPRTRPRGAELTSRRSRITNRDTLLAMSSAISIRLDGETLRALAQLEATGLSRSEAIRRAILDSASRLQRGTALAAEAAVLEADEDDRAEMLEVAAMMENMRAAG